MIELFDECKQAAERNGAPCCVADDMIWVLADLAPRLRRNFERVLPRIEYVAFPPKWSYQGKYRKGGDARKLRQMLNH